MNCTAMRCRLSAQAVLPLAAPCWRLHAVTTTCALRPPPARLPQRGSDDRATSSSGSSSLSLQQGVDQQRKLWAGITSQTVSKVTTQPSSLLQILHLLYSQANNDMMVMDRCLPALISCLLDYIDCCRTPYFTYLALHVCD
jgi:hypothetical protein